MKNLQYFFVNKYVTYDFIDKLNCFLIFLFFKLIKIDEESVLIIIKLQHFYKSSFSQIAFQIYS